MREHSGKVLQFALSLLFGWPVLILSLRIVRWWNLQPNMGWSILVSMTALVLTLYGAYSLTNAITKRL